MERSAASGQIATPSHARPSSVSSPTAAGKPRIASSAAQHVPIKAYISTSASPTPTRMTLRRRDFVVAKLAGGQWN
jgi:pectin methylesterase-like acyl-CoA thioesterase